MKKLIAAFLILCLTMTAMPTFAMDGHPHKHSKKHVKCYKPGSYCHKHKNQKHVHKFMQG